MKTKLRARCFFDIEIGHSPAGRIIFELYDDRCPKTAENFIKLCTGECGISETTGKKLHYISSTFHRVIKGFMIQGGDFVNGDGTGGESIYGGRFADENLEIPHDKPFLLSMANGGPNTNGSQFFITTKPTSHLDGKHVVFGHVVSGENLIESIENLPVNANNRPIVEATISNCGKLIPIRKKKSKKQKEKEASVESSSSKGKKKKKSKKKKHRSKRKTKLVAQESEPQEIYPKCSVRPDEIPEVPKPYFLYRGNLKEEQEKNETKEDNKNVESSQYPAKDMIGRSGRVIKGRGQLKYYSKSPCDRAEIPPYRRRDTHRSEFNNKMEGNEGVLKRRRSRSTSPYNQDRERYRHSQYGASSSRQNTKARDNYDSSNHEKRKKYDIWKDTHTDDKSGRPKHPEPLKDYGDIEMVDKHHEKLNPPESDRKQRSRSYENAPNADRDNKVHSNNHKSNKSKPVAPVAQPDKADAPNPGTIIFPYADESDDSTKLKRSEKADVRQTKGDPKSTETKERNEETSNRNATNVKTDSNANKSNRNDYESTKTNDRHSLPKRRSSSSDSHKSQSKSPVGTKRQTHSPPAHLIAKWQNRREKIMIRRSPVSRSKEQNNSRSRHSPRKHSNKYSPKNNNLNENKSSEPPIHKVVSDNVRKIPDDKIFNDERRRSSSGTMDSSLSSAGSSVVNDSTANQELSAKKEKKPESTPNNVEVTDETKPESNATEKETVMILKPAEKPWMANVWSYEEEETNKRNSKTTNPSVLAKLIEDNKKKKSQEKQEKTLTTLTTDIKKVASPVSQSISRYRSPSGTKSSDDDNRRSTFSSSSSSRSYSRRRSGRRRSKTHSRSRSRSKSDYRRRYRNSRYRRSARRSTSRSAKRYRSRSHSYNRGFRRRYSSRSSSTSSSRYRSSRRNYRGLGFRRPSVSPRPRK